MRHYKDENPWSYVNKKFMICVIEIGCHWSNEHLPFNIEIVSRALAKLLPATAVRIVILNKRTLFNFV